jgi:hypothetical protein
MKSTIWQIIGIIIALLGMLAGIIVGVYWVAVLNFLIIIMNISIIVLKSNNAFDKY